MMTTTGTSGKDATLSANLGEHQRHVPSAVAMQIAPIVVPKINSRVKDERLFSYRRFCPLPRSGDKEARLVNQYRTLTQ